MPRVLNSYKDEIPRDGSAVYVGRPSPFGNPFYMDKESDRTRVIKKHREYVCDNPELIGKIERELKGKDLVCFCAPKPCHADFLLELANAPAKRFIFGRRR